MLTSLVLPKCRSSPDIFEPPNEAFPRVGKVAPQATDEGETGERTFLYHYTNVLTTPKKFSTFPSLKFFEGSKGTF